MKQEAEEETLEAWVSLFFLKILSSISYFILVPTSFPAFPLLFLFLSSEQFSLGREHFFSQTAPFLQPFLSSLVFIFPVSQFFLSVNYDPAN